MYNIVLVVKDDLYRAGFVNIFQDSRFKIVGDGKTVAEALDCANGAQVDLVVIDIGPDDDGVAAAVGTVREMAPGAKVAIVVPSGAMKILMEALQLQVEGTFLRDMSVRAFMDSLAVVLAGEPVYPGCMLRDIVVAGPRPGAGMPPNRPGRPVDKLSERERMVLVSLTEGLSNKDIGRRLGLAENTVKVHLRRICRVLRVNNRTQAAVVGLKQLPEQSDTAP